MRGLEARVVESNQALADTTLTAPFDGVIAQRFVEENQTVQARQPIVKFQDVDEIDVAVDVPETVMVADLRSASIVQMMAEFTAAPGVQFPVRIKEMSKGLIRAAKGDPCGALPDSAEKEIEGLLKYCGYKTIPDHLAPLCAPPTNRKQRLFCQSSPALHQDTTPVPAGAIPSTTVAATLATELGMRGVL